MEFTAKQIAETLNGHIQGNPDVSICKLAKIEQATKGSLSFLSNPLYAKYIYTTKASIVIVDEKFIPGKPISTTLIKVKNSYSSFAKFLEIYNQIKLDKKGISNKAFISENAKIGKDVYIGGFTFIGENVSIGKNVKIYPNSYIGDNASIDDNTILFAGVKIYSDNVIGKNCIIHAGVVIGADGFGFAPQTDNKYKKISQIGNVIIEDNVEIGANTTIDRATLGSTIIHKGVKLDNLIQVAHNVEIGENTVIAAQTGISGSTKIGKNCMIGGQVGISGHLTIADNVQIAAQSGIMSNLRKNGKVMGSPAFKSSKYKKSYINFRKLYDIEKRITELEKNK